MSPEVVLSPTWIELALLLERMWLFLLLQVTFAFSLLLAHGVIPSLVTTGHLPPAVSRLRPIFYGGFFLFFLAAVLTITSVFWSPQALINVLYDAIWNRRWI